jgi:hypothetical protein
MPIDFDYSVHVKGKHINPLGGHRYVGLYENQVIETQLAGGLVVSRLGDIPSELIMLPEVSIVDSYEFDAVYAVLVDQLDNFKEYSSLSKKKALERHDYLKTTQLLLQHIKNRL